MEKKMKVSFMTEKKKMNIAKDHKLHALKIRKGSEDVDLLASERNEADMYNAKCGYIHRCYQGVKSLFSGWFQPFKNAISGEQNLCKEGENRGAYAHVFD
ncbi:hypothetical protein Tco_0455443 [Tanacetum coccineum]